MAKASKAPAAVETDARLRFAQSFGDLALWEFDVASWQITPSVELNRLCGFPDDARPTVADYLAIYAPGEAERVKRLNEDAAARGVSKLEYEVKHILHDGSVKWLLMRSEAAAPMPGHGPRVLGVAIDITGRKLAEEALRRSETRLRLAQQAGGIAAFELDIATGDMIVSDNFWSLWGLTPHTDLNIDQIQVLVLPESQRVISTAANRQDGTASTKIEFKMRRGDTGEVRWMSREAEFVRDEHGAPVTMYGAIRDITATKLAEERQALLTHELQHRIKNILATVSAIASQTLRTGDLETSRESFMMRIKALSEAHNILTATRWTDASLRSVVEAAIAPHDMAGRIALHGEDLRLNPRMALSLALAVNELATNAIKYGALSNGTGRVTVEWHLHTNGAGPELIWTWRETGGPQVAPPNRRGFGSVLIERVLGADFGGSVRLEYAPAGVVAELKVPAANFPERE